MGTELEKDVDNAGNEAPEEELSVEELFDQRAAEIDGTSDLNIEEEKEPETAQEEEQEQEEESSEEESTEKEDEASSEDNKEEEANQEEDPLAALPKEVREELLLLRHKEKSFSGRHRSWTEKLSAQANKISKLERDLAEAIPTEINIEDGNEMQTLAENHPHIYKAIKEAQEAGAKAAVDNVSENSPAPNGADPGELDVDMEEEARKLDAEVGNWREIINNSFFTEKFLPDLPPKLAALADSNYAEDAIYLLKEVYQPYVDEYNAGQSANESTAPEDNSEQDDGSTSEAAEKAKERRKKALENTEVGSSAGARKVEDESDESEVDRLFNMRAKEIDKQRRNQRF